VFQLNYLTYIVKVPVWTSSKSDNRLGLAAGTFLVSNLALGYANYKFRQMKKKEDKAEKDNMNVAFQNYSKYL